MAEAGSDSVARSAATFLMAGGGTGGHVIPLIAVAEELRRRGHQPVFIGTESGFEARMVPSHGFPLEFVRIGQLKRVGLLRRLQTLMELPLGAWTVAGIIGRYRPAAMFSLGGYVAGPAVLGAMVKRVPIVAMEPNAAPGFTNRHMGRFSAKTLIAFPETAAYFPAGKTELTGLPVRDSFFHIPPRPFDGLLNVLITGGSRGSRTLNRAAREAWPRLRESGLRVRLLHQAGRDEFEAVRGDFESAGVWGEVVAFIEDMPAAFRAADLVIGRAGAGAVAELAAAGKPSVLVPFPFAADDHQKHNALAMQRAGASRMVLDVEFTGEVLVRLLTEFLQNPGELSRMGAAARSMAREGAAERAADLLEQLIRR
jgi:UDP-N-acetylglucosamine--N-acetylmuramyl-(pentapeptide) pyrophosphoryl-undecaprenol N-acetylglucosamine transferase